MNYFIDFWKKLKIQYKCVFLSTMVFGIISQGMGLFNKYSMDDDLNYFFHDDNPLYLARWVNYLLIRLERMFFGDANYTLPLINGGLAVLFIGAAMCLLVNLMDIRSTFLCILLGGIAVSIPCVTYLFGNMFIAHFYGLALFLAVLGPYLILKHDHWIYTAAGIILMVISKSIYQTYIPVMLCTFLGGLMKKCLDCSANDRWVALYKKAGIVIFSCLAFIGLYLGVSNLLNKHYNIVLGNYKNIGTMGKLPLTVYLKRIVITYRKFFFPSRIKYFDLFPGNIRLLHYGMTALFLILSAIILYKCRKKYLMFWSMLLLTALVPLAVNFIFVMVEESFCSILMLYGETMFFVIFAWLLEESIGSIQHAAAKIGRVVCCACVGLFVLMYCRYDNVCYLQMELLQTQAIRYFTTLITRIQSVEDYDSYRYISYIGTPTVYKNDNSIEPIPELDQFMSYPYWGLRQTLTGPWKKYMRIWCGYTVHELDQSYFIDLPEVQRMPRYPAEGSIKVINDTIVVKF